MHVPGSGSISRRRWHRATLALGALLSLVLGSVATSAPDAAAPAAAAPDPADAPCRVVANWDAERDLVAYEIRRDGCPAEEAWPSEQPPGRRNNIYELRRISTGQLVDVADCEISHSLDGAHPCDLGVLHDQRRTFGRLRGKRGQPVDCTPDRLTIPSAGSPVTLSLPPLDARIVDCTRDQTHTFVRVRAGREETLLRLPVAVPDRRRRQQDLLAQAAVCAESGLLDRGRPLVHAARAQGPLDPRALVPAFCQGLDVARRIEIWRLASAELDPGERSAAEAALAGRGCFPGVDVARYDAAGPALEAARRWIDAVGRKDRGRIRALSAFPLVVRGLWDLRRAPELAACGGHASGGGRPNESVLEVADARAWDRAAPCLLDGNLLTRLDPLPALRDGRWPPDRGNPFDRTVGTTLPIDPARVPRAARGLVREVAPLLRSGTLVQAVLTDNDGLTDTFVLIVDPDDGGGARVRVVTGSETFRD